MRKLLLMWEGIFPQQLLNVLKQKVEQPKLGQNSGMPRSGPPAQYHSNPQAQFPSIHWTRSQGPAQQPVSSSGRNGYPTESHIPHQSGRQMSAAHQRPQYVYQHPASFQPADHSKPGPMHEWRSQEAARAQYPMTQQSSCQPLVLPHLLSSLLSSGLLTVPASVSIAPPAPQAAGPAVYYTQPPSRAATPEAVTAEDCNFVPSRLKVLSLFLLQKLLQMHRLMLCCRDCLHVAFASMLLASCLSVG